jgi:hypothetical protein
MERFRVMYILKNFPQMSETYIKTEIEAVREFCEIGVVSTRKANLPAKNHVPFRYVDDLSMAREAVEEFRPQVLHTHWIHLIKQAGKLSRKTGIPFTARAHSFDSIWPDETGFDRLPLLRRFRFPSHIRRAVSLINDDLCLGILAFPFARPRLEKAGIRGDKVIDCWPVVNFQRFHDPSPNGEAIMNVGACIPKKKMEDFVELATRAPALQFNLYALGYQVNALREFARERNSPVNFIPAVELEEMPAEYKKHRWLVYTAGKDGRVGWPMSIAEAQAAGVGVCMANIRPDLRDYVGPAGFLYDSLDEALEIISKPFPEEMRNLGFEQAKNSDVFEHRALLFNLWRKAGAGFTLGSTEERSVIGVA